MAEHAASDGLYDAEAIMQFCDEGASTRAFNHHWRILEKSATNELDVRALRLCIRLLPLIPAGETPYQVKIEHIILDYIARDDIDTQRLYALAEICLVNHQLARAIFDGVVSTVELAYLKHGTSEINVSGKVVSNEALMQSARASLQFLTCSYWLPPDREHFITPPLVKLLLSCLGHEYLDTSALTTLSALLSLLRCPSVSVLETDDVPRDWLKVEQDASKPVLRSGILGDDFLYRIMGLSPEYFTHAANAVFCTWFQWTSYAVSNNIQAESVFSGYYWAVLCQGLQNGFADQRKYCLGALQHSLALIYKDLSNSSMDFKIGLKDETIAQYAKFCTLFEIIVLDRYPNQVQACLPELTALAGSSSLIHPSWMTALLAAALSQKVQDGIRKLVGNWYLAYVVQGHGPLTEHLTIMVEAFLPWASQGSLFTSTLISSRSATSCTHGTTLARAITKFVMEFPTNAERRSVIRRILEFLCFTHGKIFTAALLFILEGLLEGVRRQAVTLGAEELHLIVRVSRLPAMAEVARDLCLVYCAHLCEYRDKSEVEQVDVPGLAQLYASFEFIKVYSPLGCIGEATSSQVTNSYPSLKEFLEQLEASKHMSLQDDNFSPMCSTLITMLDTTLSDDIQLEELTLVLDAFWEEADREEFSREVAINLIPLFFHPTCIQACLRRSDDDDLESNPLRSLLSKALVQLHRSADGRSYLLSALATSLRKACFLCPDVLRVLPYEDFFVRLVENPPKPLKEFLFEVVAAEKLEAELPHRKYAAYYGERDWIGYAAVIDMLNRFSPNHVGTPQVETSKRILDRLISPWRAQQGVAPVVSKWKNVFQLQIMLLLTEVCIEKENADWYLDSFTHALVLEQWPRYRFVLEWIIARIYYRFPSKTSRILEGLANSDESSPIQTCSLIKLALLTAPFVNSEAYALQIMIYLVPASAGPKVQVRHESHWSFPILFELAEEKEWSSITGNVAFQALNKHVRSLYRFNTPPTTLRMLKLDPVKDFTITEIFQGHYLRAETPDYEYVSREDFQFLEEDSRNWISNSRVLLPLVPLGGPQTPPQTPGPINKLDKEAASTTSQKETTANFFQTKAGFDVASLLPSAEVPGDQQRRPASVILIASLIDNPTNLGGLSRISESFGLEALYIDDLRKISHKDFKATSVTSEKHLPIVELKVSAVPEFLMNLKRQGYVVVGIEQTDKSGLLGESEGGKGMGTLPQKCVLVLGSERGGITSEVLAVVDRCVEIRTVGVTRSLNVQTAGGITVYEWWREWGKST